MPPVASKLSARLKNLAPLTPSESTPDATTDGDELAQIFGRGGLLSRSLKGDERDWEERAEQLEMARGVRSAIDDKAHLLVEAGTGVGKSYAYLVPFILWAAKNKKRVLIATHTKALQGQLVERDLPFLRDLFRKRIGLDFKFALCLGTGNYLCPRRLAKAEAQGLFQSKQEVEQFTKIQEFGARTKTGRSVDLPFEPASHVWSQVNRESDLCMGRACPLYDNSFYYIARRQQEAAQIMVANHHLLFAHLASGGNDSGAVLPPFDALVIDEAHQAEEVAGQYLGLEVSNLSVARLIEMLHHRRGNRTILSGSALPQRATLEEKLIEAATEAREATARFFENVQVVLNVDVTRSASIRLRRPRMLENVLSEPLKRLETVLGVARKAAEATVDDALVRELEGFATRCFEMRQNLNTLLEQSREGYVFWLAVQPRPMSFGQRTPRVPRLALCGAPVDVADALQDSLFGKVCPVVLTSATLTTGGNWQFLRERLGLVPEKSEKEVRTLSLGSPFNFRENALLYLARDLPDPSQAARFEAVAIERAGELLTRTNGRAFVLCTSFRQVDAAAAHLRRVLPKSIDVLKQGEMARGRLLHQFRGDISSVLVGTSSFWQGVDVPGESLSCVVIMKLPFAVPDDPLVQARVEALQKQGRNAFNEYQVPQAAMMFRQGFGRLIRTGSDRGIVAVLDPRLVTKPYGRVFLESLPECRVTEELDDVAAFAEI